MDSRCAVTVAICFSLAAADPAVARNGHACLLSESGIEPVRLGMTLRAAQLAMPDAHFRRSTDGDGAALVTIMQDKQELMTLSAGEEDPDAAVDWNGKIRTIETFSASCKTKEGVHPGMPIEKAEKIFGKALEIVQSEIEAREYIRFQHQPAHFLIRIDYSGVFPERSRRTTKYAPGGKIFSIAVVSSQESMYARGAHGAIMGR